MRSVTTIIENRNKLKVAVNKINKKLKEIRNEKQWNDLNKEERDLIGKLYGLMWHYKDQLTALNFVLNEDSKLDDYKWISIFHEFGEFLVDFE